MNKIKLSVIITLLGLLTSCFPMVNTAKYEPANPNFSLIESPPVGQLTKVNVGQSMIENYTGMMLDGFYSNEYHDLNIPGVHSAGMLPYNVSPDKEYVVWGKLENGDLLLRNKVYVRTRIIGEKPMKPNECALLAHQNGEVYAWTYYFIGGVISEPLDTIIKMNPKKVHIKGRYSKELLYNGKTKDAIKLQYREYTNDMARPAFYQELSYDLNESKMIGFQGMEIEIVEATNMGVSYIVRKNMIQNTGRD